MRTSVGHRLPVFLLILPGLLLIAALSQRLFLKNTTEDAEASEHARALVLRELHREIERDAYTKAKHFVRARLLPPEATQEAIQQLSITHLKPHRYRIRAVVEWTQPGGARTRRNVEADLQHGPVDKNWYLVDTEFLSAAR